MESELIDLNLETRLKGFGWNAEGLLPVITQQFDTLEVLMLAWVNLKSLKTSILEKRACYWSRSRKSLWYKGETSGQIQILHEIRLDCDQDALLFLVDQHGVACHTGHESCFYSILTLNGLIERYEPKVAPNELYK